MSKFNKIISPQSLLIEKTALELAATYYEVGRSTGLTSKHKDAKAYAKANVEKFIPKAVEFLIDMMGNPAIPQDQKDLIYEALMERSNDPELSNVGIKAFENNTPYLPDAAVIFDKPTLDNVVKSKNFLNTSGGKLNG